MTATKYFLAVSERTSATGTGQTPGIAAAAAALRAENDERVSIYAVHPDTLVFCEPGRPPVFRWPDDAPPELVSGPGAAIVDDCEAGSAATVMHTTSRYDALDDAVGRVLRAFEELSGPAARMREISTNLALAQGRVAGATTLLQRAYPNDLARAVVNLIDARIYLAEAGVCRTDLRARRLDAAISIGIERTSQS